MKPISDKVFHRLNYGAIGAVTGREVTHGIDDSEGEDEEEYAKSEKKKSSRKDQALERLARHLRYVEEFKERREKRREERAKRREERRMSKVVNIVFTTLRQSTNEDALQYVVELVALFLNVSCVTEISACCLNMSAA
uniref:BHLH domain-containing protein n=1 Tax=Angiostrongylus cantonensis TaxID=6313 RepID=A0A0K0DBD7_ANGCA